MSAWTVVAAVVAGGIGAGLRYIVDVLVTRARARPGHAQRFPLGILIINVTGSLALGIVTGVGAAALGEWLTIIGLGLLGGYTTFSTVSVETVLLAQERRVGHAIGNLLITMALAVTAAAGGYILGAAWGGAGG